MKTVRILTIGSVKEPHWRDAAVFYLKRLERMVDIQHTAIKDAPAKFTEEVRCRDESQRMLKLIKPTDTLICLDEQGKLFTSRELSAYIGKLYDRGKTPCFTIGGAYGHSKELVTKAECTIALSPMTFTHEMAYVVLLEQIYRAENILLGTGYHHG